MSAINTTATGREHIRQLNTRVVLNAIHRHGRISRIALAEELKLSPAAVTHITGALLAKAVIFEARQGTSDRVGRKPILLEINYDSAYVLGAKVSNTAVTTALTNLKAEVIAYRSDQVEHCTPESVAAVLEQAIQELSAEAEVPPSRLVGLGVDLPGIVDSQAGVVRHSPLLGWYDVPFAALVQSRLALPTLVENDVNALAVAEAWFGYGRSAESFLVVTLGRGVGLGIILDGNVYRGPTGGAGEFGHLVLDPEGPVSPDGERGSLEAYLSDAALLTQARRHIAGFAREATHQDLVDLADRGDPQAVAVFRDAGRMLGLALSHLVNIFAPPLIILSGEGVRAAHLLLPAARDALALYSFGDLGRRVELIVDSWGDEAWARGAAGLAASRHLESTATTLGGDG